MEEIEEILTQNKELELISYGYVGNDFIRDNPTYKLKYKDDFIYLKNYPNDDSIFDVIILDEINEFNHYFVSKELVKEIGLLKAINEFKQYGF